MQVTRVDLVNGSRVLLLEDFFPGAILQDLLTVCDTWPELWTVPFDTTVVSTACDRLAT
jgi:hypothetical protein